MHKSKINKTINNIDNTASSEEKCLPITNLKKPDDK